MKRQAALPWDKVQSLIDWASDPTDAGESRRAVLKHGTPEMKMEILREQLGVEFADLEAMHAELEKIIYKGSIPWWWW
ncbi:MAG TPA: hypothetical protein VJJ46_03350 [Anaerolineales bacterium]|nr:hypothetical protein [Anaerolineales bacterium]